MYADCCQWRMLDRPDLGETQTISTHDNTGARGVAPELVDLQAAVVARASAGGKGDLNVTDGGAAATRAVEVVTPRTVRANA
jgi:hypothetical protein